MNQHYNPFGFLFYPLTLVVLFTGIYFIWENNPSLMDQLSLIEKQSKKERRDSFLVQTSPISTEDMSRFNPSGFKNLQAGQARHYSGELRINHRFSTYDDYQGPSVETPAESWVVDNKGLLFQSPKELRFVKHNGQEDWSFKLTDAEPCDGTAALSQDFIFTCTKSGDLLALYRDSGRVAWIHRTQYKFWRSPLLTTNQLLIFDEGEEYFHIISVQRDTGVEEWKMRTLAKSTNSEFAFSDDYETIVFSSDENWLYAYDIKKQEKLWEQELAQSPGASPIVHGKKVYLSGADGLLTSYELKNGKPDWEYDLTKPLNTSLTVLPGINIGTIVDAEGYLHVLDLKAGKRKWRYNMKSNSKARELHGIRMSSSSQAKLNMTPESKGWSFWGACGNNQVCAFEPFKGFMLRRFELPGPMAAAPILIDKGQELLLSYFEGKTLKFLKFIEKSKLDLMAENAKAAAEAEVGDNPTLPADATVDNVEPEN